MRWFVVLALAFALGVTGCADEGGGTAGGGGGGGNCGGQGLGGGAPTPEGGVYGTYWPDVALPYRACVYVNENCTGLEASTKCNIGEDASQAHFLEVEWTDGRTDTGDECAASVSVTADLVNEIPIDERRDGFRIELTDDDGADWEISGYWSYHQLILAPARTTEDGVCRPHVDYPAPVWCIADSRDLCLENASDWIPPELVSFDFSPTRVDVTAAPANVVCEMTLTHPSGVDDVYCLFRSPSGESHSCRADSPGSGDIFDGVWSCTTTIPKGAEPGLWYFRPIAGFALTPSPSAWLEVDSR